MNESLFFLIHSLAGRSSLLDSLFVFCAATLGPLMILLLLLLPFILRIQIKRQTWVWVAFIIVSALVARFGPTEIIRALYPVSRPFVVMPKIVPLIKHPPTSAFPSGHAVFYFALATGVFLWMTHLSRTAQWPKAKTIGFLYGGGALLVGIGRIAVGVHWPFDIGAGAVVGIATVYGLYMFLRRRLLLTQG